MVDARNSTPSDIGAIQLAATSFIFRVIQVELNIFGYYWLVGVHVGNGVSRMWSGMSVMWSVDNVMCEVVCVEGWWVYCARGNECAVLGTVWRYSECTLWRGDGVWCGGVMSVLSAYLKWWLGYTMSCRSSVRLLPCYCHWYAHRKVLRSC